jgi:PAS domain S-box-containing protein
MTLTPGMPGSEHQAEVSALIATLQQADERLDKLLLGRVDAVTSQDGRILVLQRAQHRRQLRETARQAAILSALPSPIAVLDGQGVIVSVNEAWQCFAAANGLVMHDQGVGASYLGVCDAAQGDGATRARQAAAGIRAVLDGSCPMFTLDYGCDSPTERRWFLMRVVPLTDTQPHGAVVMHVDISQRKQAETALHASEIEFRTLADAMPQMVWTAKAQGGLLYSNQRWGEYTGLTQEEGLGDGWSGVMHPDDLQRAWDALHQAMQTASIYTTEVRLRRADGIYHWWLVRAVAQRDAQGEVLKWFGTSTDIQHLKAAESEQTRTNRELMRQGAELRVLIDLMPAMVWFKDTDNKVLRVNQRAAQRLGRTIGEIEGQSAEALFPEQAASHFAADLAVIRSGQPALGLVTNVRDADGERWLQTDRVPYRDDSGQVVGVVVMAQDITDRKRDQDALHQLNAELEQRVRSRTREAVLAREEAEQANRAKSGFLAAMSHEIRTPMNGVIGMLDVLHQSSLTERQVEMIDLIRDSAFSLLQIVDNILDFSKIEAGRLSVEHAPVALAELVEKTCGMLDPLAAKQNVRLSVFVDPALPRRLRGDESRLRQVLVNLAGNAIKFSGGRSTAGRVSVRMVPVANSAHGVALDLVVADNGIGMDEAALGHLFKPFEQADASTTRRFGGTGLGLAITDMLVHLMGGTIAVHSTVGRGSTFTVRLRLALDAGDSRPTPGRELAGMPCRIVGAEEPLGDDLSAYLRAAGATVRRSSDLAAAGTAGAEAGLQVWLVLPDALPDVTLARPAELPAMADAGGMADIRFVTLRWGHRRRPRMASIDCVTLDINAAPRRTVLKAVGMAADRPITDDTQVDVPIRPNPGHAPTRLQALEQGRLILVAEDNDINRIVVLQQLALLGFAADCVADGAQALVSWRTGDYALLLTDLHMPQLDGHALASAIRAEETAGRRTPIIALTANALRDEERRCRASGMDGYLTKPVRLTQLKAAVEGWLGASPARADASRTTAHAAAAARPAPADLDVLAALVGDDPVVINEVLHAFRASATLSGELIRDAAARGAMPAVADAAHKLKSAAQSIGALRLAELCAQIEHMATHPAAEPSPLLPLFDAELQAVLRFIAPA